MPGMNRTWALQGPYTNSAPYAYTGSSTPQLYTQMGPVEYDTDTHTDR